MPATRLIRTVHGVGAGFIGLPAGAAAADPAARETVAAPVVPSAPVRSRPARFGPASLANRIALSKQSGRDGRAEIDDLTARHDEAMPNGTRAPAIFH
jgi:hypothetical protein